MGILLAIIVGVASILNLMYGQNQLIQYLLTVLSVISLIIYRGKELKGFIIMDMVRIILR